jgi:hypothetical protein
MFENVRLCCWALKWVDFMVIPVSTYFQPTPGPMKSQRAAIKSCATYLAIKSSLPAFELERRATVDMMVCFVSGRHDHGHDPEFCTSQMLQTLYQNNGTREGNEALDFESNQNENPTTGVEGSAAQCGSD